jgi:hypothetical protein
MQHAEQNEESQKVKKGTDRPYHDHEVTDECHVPVSRATQIVSVHAVQRDRNLGNVIKKVVQQDLQRQHRQEGQEECSAGHAEHVAEIRTGAHHNVLHDVAERASSFLNTIMHDTQVVLKQNERRSLFGHINGTIHREADIGGMQGRGVVDAIA